MQRFLRAVFGEEKMEQTQPTLPTLVCKKDEKEDDRTETWDPWDLEFDVRGDFWIKGVNMHHGESLTAPYYFNLTFNVEKQEAYDRLIKLGMLDMPKIDKFRGDGFMVAHDGDVRRLANYLAQATTFQDKKYEETLGVFTRTGQCPPGYTRSSCGCDCNEKK